MLKVCGVTYDHTTNYGSCFQAYALQTAIEQMKIRGDACRYQLIPLLYCRDYPYRKIKGKKAFLLRLLLKIYRMPFALFEKKYMHYAKVRYLTDLEKLNESNDAFVCGSDVIWKPMYNYDLPAYYLGFAKKYAFSYAASFGIAEIEEIIQKHQEHLKKLDQISLRESCSKALVDQYTGKSAEVVADPVLLLDQEQWNQVAGPSKNKDKYILVYFSKFTTDSLTQFTENLQKATNLKIVQLFWYASQIEVIKKGKIIAESPQKWLQLIRDAECVVTNSFHATVFSTIFKKKFFTVVSGKLQEDRNIRMYDYLKKIGLLDRMLSDFPASIDCSPIDYSEADKQISQIREHSKDYLIKNLEAAYLQKEQN